MYNKRSFKWLALLMALLCLALGSHSASAASATTNLQFVNHIQAGLPEQDVFVERNDINLDQVMRVEGKDAADASNGSKVLYASAAPTAHDPFKLGSSPLGPFPKGARLGITLQQWLAANGSGTYVVNGSSSELHLAFQKLVANGVYTVWCSRLTFPPKANVVDTACGAPDGSQNVIKTDAQGLAVFNLALPTLPESSKETASVIALAYHSDGKTYGAKPGDFGLNSHLHIFALMPVPAAPSTLPTTGAASESLPVSVLAFSGGLLLLATAWLLRQRHGHA